MNAGRELPRGIRNHNPGNIRHGRSNWQGMEPKHLQTDSAFVRFTTPAWGIRALARLLIGYYDRSKGDPGGQIDTIEEAIQRWAPPIENNTRAYVHRVDAEHPKAATDVLDFHDYDDLMPLVRAIINHENGNPRLYGRKEWYPQAVIDEGLRRAGVVPKPKPALKDPEVATAATTAAAGGATVIGGGVYALTEIQSAAGALTDAGRAKIEAGEDGTWLVMGGALLLVGGLVAVAILAWRRLRVRR